ncbi:MAG: RDD family protein [Chloroflexota bacterium]|nr:RDD family protein [Chloroflexota bacterium]
MSLPRTAGQRAAVASVRARAGGYIVDMVILAAVSLVLVVAGGLFVLISTGWATSNISDPVVYEALAIVGLGTPLVWSLMNLLLLATRQQTGGQYVAGVRLAREDGAPLTRANLLAWWFLVNPLLFSWPMACAAGLPLAGVISLALGRLTVAVFVTVVTLCVVAPLIALVSAALDGQNRALHDRIVGTVVVPAD